tara:strand:+ start:137 stop:316 length:180 start_codon:yes stop_codon:yes gene_type:complete
MKQYDVLSILEEYSTRSYSVEANSKEEAIEKCESGEVEWIDSWEDDCKEHGFEAVEASK